MSAKKFIFGSPETYLSGMTALSIPDEGRIGGDWHFAAALRDPRARLQSAGAKGNLTNTNAIFGHRWVQDKAQILRERGIELAEDHVFCASHPRAVADLLHHALVRNIFPAHVSLDGGIFEEVVEFDHLEELLAVMIAHLSQAQVDDLLRWKGTHFYPAKEGVSVEALTGHARIDHRSLALHRLIAEKIRKAPDLMDVVRSNLQQTLEKSDLAESLKRPLHEWQTILQTRAFEDILHILTEDSDEGQRLRSSTPFWGIITQQERREIFARYLPKTDAEDAP